MDYCYDAFWDKVGCVCRPVGYLYHFFFEESRVGGGCYYGVYVKCIVILLNPTFLVPFYIIIYRDDDFLIGYVVGVFVSGCEEGDCGFFWVLVFGGICLLFGEVVI